MVQAAASSIPLHFPQDLVTATAVVSNLREELRKRDDAIHEFNIAYEASKADCLVLETQKSQIANFASSRESEFRLRIQRLDQQVFSLESGQIPDTSGESRLTKELADLRIDHTNSRVAVHQLTTQCASLTAELASLRAGALGPRTVAPPVPGDIRHPSLHVNSSLLAGASGEFASAHSQDDWYDQGPQAAGAHRAAPPAQAASQNTVYHSMCGDQDQAFSVGPAAPSSGLRAPGQGGPPEFVPQAPVRETMYQAPRLQPSLSQQQHAQPFAQPLYQPAPGFRSMLSDAGAAESSD